MAHNLNIQADQAAMMYVGKTPWHGLGTRLEQPATAAAAIQAAKLDWPVTKKLRYPWKQEGYAVVREDSHCVLGWAGRNYTPLQNREAFGFFDLIAGSGAAIYHTAGALGKGERVWIMAKLPSNIRVTGDDIAQKFLLLSNSHDGKSSVEIKLTPVRVVCQNTLTLALSLGSTLQIPHSRNIAQQMFETAMLFHEIELRFADMEKVFKAMAARQFGTKDLQAYLQQVFPDPQPQNDDEQYGRLMGQARLDRLSSEYLFEEGLGNNRRPVRGTLWAAFNGVTEYIDHRRYQNLPLEDRWVQLWFGMGYSAKNRAYQTANAMLRTRCSSYIDSGAIARITPQHRQKQLA